MNARRNEIVIAGLDRESAEALLEEGNVGEAATRGREALRLVLAESADAELVALGKGVRALDSLMSHDYDMVVIDESDGVGLITGDEYRDLFALLQLLRNNKVEPDRVELLARVHAALERGLTAAQADEGDYGVDHLHDFQAAEIADELLPPTQERQEP